MSNTTHPMLPDYTGPTSGLFAFVHHDLLYEWSDNIMERVVYVRANKPARELETRAHCMVCLDPTGQPWLRAYDERRRAYDERRRADGEWLRADAERLRAYDERRRAYGELRRADGELRRAAGELRRAEAEYRRRAYAEWQRAEAEWERAYAEWQRADGEWERAYAEWQRAEAEHAPQIEAQIRTLVPDLPWDGQTLIWPQEEEAR